MASRKRKVKKTSKVKVTKRVTTTKDYSIELSERDLLDALAKAGFQIPEEEGRITITGVEGTYYGETVDMEYTMRVVVSWTERSDVVEEEDL